MQFETKAAHTKEISLKMANGYARNMTEHKSTNKGAVQQVGVQFYICTVVAGKCTKMYRLIQNFPHVAVAAANDLQLSEMLDTW
jgi:ribosomal protein S17E